MRPIFTIHAGEYLVGDYIERVLSTKQRPLRVWIPSKDDGIDLLVTNRQNSKTVSLQVNYSKDFFVNGSGEQLHNDKVGIGWWTLHLERAKMSEADFWVLVLHSHFRRDGDNFNFQSKGLGGIFYVVVEPKELASRLDCIHRPKNKSSVQTYLHVVTTEHGLKCLERRSVAKQSKGLTRDEWIAANPERDFTQFLSNWSPVLSGLE